MPTFIIECGSFTIECGSFILECASFTIDAPSFTIDAPSFRIDEERTRRVLVWHADRTAGQTFAVVAAATGIALLVVASSLITFVGVCAPAGAYAIDLGRAGGGVQVLVWIAGLVVGLALAVAVGYGITAAFFRSRKPFDPRIPPPPVDKDS